MTPPAFGRQIGLFVAFLLLRGALSAATVPTFVYQGGSTSYTLVGNDPVRGGTTKIPVVLVPVSLTFSSRNQVSLDASADVAALGRSPIFEPAAWIGAGRAQYGDAMLRATFPKARDWHTLLVKSEVSAPVAITVPVSAGYLLHSEAGGRWLGIADVEYVQRELFKRVPNQSGKLVLAVTHNTAFYSEADATICCEWGTHGSDAGTGNSFVLASYLSAAPSIVQESDVQPFSEQLAEFLYDPLHDPLVREGREGRPGNHFPRWQRQRRCVPVTRDRAGVTRWRRLTLLEPTDTNRKNNLPESAGFEAGGYHLQNVALLPWYLGADPELGNQFSFPDPHALTERARPCAPRPAPGIGDQSARAAVRPAAQVRSGSGHALIGYWTGSERGRSGLPLRDISPQWDVAIVAFAVPDHSAPEGTLRFEPPKGMNPAELKRDIAWLKSQGKTVLLSLGGGGQYFSLYSPESTGNFVASTGSIIADYGFEGVDLDFESPSLELVEGDTDFRHPTSPSTMHLLAGLQQLRARFGTSFKVTLVPEGPQIPAGHSTYGGQFGSYLPIAYGLRDILWFMDVQDYNTPPIEGLDGEIYQAGSVDYHAAVTELVLHGFAVQGRADQMFPAPAQDRVAVGYLIGETTPDTVFDSMSYLLTGKRPDGVRYGLREPHGYPGMLGAMFWTIDADARQSYRFSNRIGPELHSFKPDAKR